MIVNEKDNEDNDVVNIYEGEEKGEGNPVATVDANNYFMLDELSDISYHINGNYLETLKTLTEGYYIVEESGEPNVYEWASYGSGVGDEGKVWWYYSNNSQKEIKMKYERDAASNIGFLINYDAIANPVDNMDYESCSSDGHAWPFYIPTQIYKTLNIKRTKWNVEVQITNKTISDEYEIVKYTGNGILTFNTYSNATVSTPQYIKLRTQMVDDEEYLAIDLYEGWQTEISNLYLVYKTSVNSVLKAIDAYKLTFEDANYILTEQTLNSQSNLIFDCDINNNNGTLQLDSNNKTISDLVQLYDNSISTYYELSPTNITAKLFRDNNGQLQDLSDYITLTINSSGEIVGSLKSGYVFSSNSNNLKISTADDLKLVLYMFSNNKTVFFVVEIDKICNLSLNVIQSQSS